MKVKKFSPRKLLSLFLIGIVIIAFLVLALGAKDVFNAAGRIDLRIYAIAFGIETLALLIWLAKWKVLTLAVDVKVRTRRLFPILLSGIFFNRVLPSAKVGGEPLRAYAFSRLGNVTMSKSFATVAVDRILDFIPYLAVTFVALGVILFTWQLSVYIVLMLAIIALLVAVFSAIFIYFCLRPKAIKRFGRWVMKLFSRVIALFGTPKLIELKVGSFIENFSRNTRAIFRKRSHVILALTLSALYWLLSLTRMYVVFVALGQPISFWAVGIATIAGITLHIVPIPGALGVAEGAYVLIFSAAGVPVDVAVAAALLDRGISFWYTGLIGAVGTSWTGLKLIRD